MCDIGILSDTHGVISDEVLNYLKGCKVIFHAGDIGSASILEELKKIASVYAVRGNNDQGKWCEDLPKEISVIIEDKNFYMIHDLKTMAKDPLEYDIILSGHSHALSIYQKKKQLYINPGAVSKPRFGLPLTLIKLNLDAKMKIEVITI